MNNNQYCTRSLALAAAISLFFPLDGIDKRDPQNAEFIFERKPGLDEAIEQYWSNTMLVSPQSYFYQLKKLKARLYEKD